MFTNLLVHLHAHPSGRGVFFLVTFSLLVSVPMAYSPGKPIGEWSRSWRWFGWWKGPRSFVGPSASSCHVARGFGGDGEFAQRKDWTGVHVEDEQRGRFEGPEWVSCCKLEAGEKMVEQCIPRCETNQYSGSSEFLLYMLLAARLPLSHVHLQKGVPESQCRICPLLTVWSTKMMN